MTDLTRTPKILSDMDKKKDIIGGSETPVVTDKKVTTTPPTTSIGATAPSQSEDEYNEQPQTPQTPPQTMPAQPQPTQVAPTAPSLAAQPPGEEDEYNETPQAPPTTPAPAVTTTAPQYTDTDTDRRNQANLAAQTTTAPTANENMILQFDENNNPVLVKADVATPKITPKTTDTAPSTTTPATEGEEYHTYRDIFAKLAPQTSDEDKKKQMRRERRKAIVSALGDGLSALSNLYFTTKGAPDQGLNSGMTDAAKKRMDDLRTQWQKEKDKYQELMLKGLEMDREQGNWLKSYELQINADKRAQKELTIKEEEWEKKKPILTQELEKNKQELVKLERENNIGNATWEEEVALQKKKIAQQEREIEERNKPGNHGMTDAEKYQFDQKTSISRAANAETARHHRATEAAANKRNKQKGNNTLSSVNAGKTFHPNNQQVQDAYRYLAGRHFVDGKATTIQGMLNEIQNYMTTGRNRNAKSHGKNRVDDITGGPIVDTMLGGERDNTSDNEGAYDNF